MFLPTPFSIRDDDTIYEFIEHNAFGELTSLHRNRLVATPMPFLLSEDRQYLLGHLARANAQHDDIAGQEVLVSLLGPHAYVSPSWCRGASVPTWNYQVAHIYGSCRTFNDKEALRRLVDALTEKYESNLPTPWVSAYNATMLESIVGIKIHIHDIQCKFKLSQNKPRADQESIARELDRLGSSAVASAMKAE